jgi:hypothetical protein
VVSFYFLQEVSYDPKPCDCLSPRTPSTSRFTFLTPTGSASCPRPPKGSEGTRRNTLHFSSVNRTFQAYPQECVAKAKPILRNCREGCTTIPGIDVPQQRRHLYHCHLSPAYLFTGIVPLELSVECRLDIGKLIRWISLGGLTTLCVSEPPLAW